MNDILKSPQGLVFIIMAIAATAALFLDKITGEQFLSLVTLAFAFYFATPPSQMAGGVK